SPSFFLLLLPRHPRSTLFPYTTLFRSVIVAVTSTPFKCPPAPSETALLMNDYLTARGLRERSQISLVMPMDVPIPPCREVVIHRSEEHTSELQSRGHLVCRLLLEKKKE